MCGHVSAKNSLLPPVSWRQPWPSEPLHVTASPETSPGFSSPPALEALPFLRALAWPRLPGASHCSSTVPNKHPSVWSMLLRSLLSPPFLRGSLTSTPPDFGPASFLCLLSLSSDLLPPLRGHHISPEPLRPLYTPTASVPLIPVLPPFLRDIWGILPSQTDRYRQTAFQRKEVYWAPSRVRRLLVGCPVRQWLALRSLSLPSRAPWSLRPTLFLSC